MELRSFAERILLSRSLEEKLRPPEEPLTDDHPGAPLRVDRPERPPELQFAPKRKSVKMPHPKGLHEARLRAAAHHVMANHELQALELMAWTLLAFPDAPADFRRELVPILLDEQRHTRWHLKRLDAHGLDFGALPLNGFVWLRTFESRSLLDYLACLPLTFEGGNLDHSLTYGRRFDEVGDLKSGGVMRAIHRDEIGHVAFGLRWLRRLKPAELSDWETYLRHLRGPLKPCDARGVELDVASRKAAGLDDDFL
ncbi:MAG: DUF455 family protein, partial [Planctomycetia bacterium]